MYFYLFMIEKNKQIKEIIFRDALLLIFSLAQETRPNEQDTSRLLWQPSDRYESTLGETFSKIEGQQSIWRKKDRF